MKPEVSFKEYYTSINQSHFENKDYGKHNYVNDVIEKLIKCEPIKLGKTGNDGVFQLDKKADSDIIKKLTKNPPKTANEFNELFKEKFNGKNLWTSIFKGTFSGYETGLAHKNKGNAFENEIMEGLSNKDSEIYKNIVDCFPDLSSDKVGIKEFKAVGGDNNKRPIEFTADGPLAGGTLNDIGKTVSDVTIIDNNNKEYYISAKYGNTVTFGNLGVKKFFPTEWFKGEGNLPENGKILLNLFGISENKFKNIFVSYEDMKKLNPDKKKGDGTKKIVSYEIDSDDNSDNKAGKPNFKQITNLAKSCIGYGYLLVHKSNNGHIEYIDLLTSGKRDSLLGGITKYEIQYPDNSKSLAGKRIDIIVEFKDIIFNFNIRPSDGTIFPTRLHANYTFKKW